MKRKLVLSIPLFFVLLTGCGYAAPEKAVRQEMELIRKLDESTIKAFVSYEDIRHSNAETPEIGEETTEAVKLFFKNFKYKIRSSSVTDDEAEATVTLDITNIDAELLARDLCGAMIADSVTQEGEPEPEGLASSFALMKTCLEENDYPLKTTQATVHLTNKDDVWIIQESAELEDEIAGGFVTYLRDPYLLSPQEVLDYTLQPFKSFNAPQWSYYLNLSDIFSVGADFSAETDAAVAALLEKFFDYQITDVRQEENTAYADVTITSFDLESVLAACKDDLLAYAQTTESIRASDEEITAKTAALLLDALNACDQSTQNTVTISLINNGYAWEVQLDEIFADALLGSVDAATEILYSSEASE